MADKMVIAILFEEPDSDDPKADTFRMAEIIERAQKVAKDVPDVKVIMTRGGAADTIHFFVETGELPVEEARKKEENEPGTLWLHAKSELEIIGEEPEVIEGYLKVIKAFEDMDHSGASAMIAIPVLNALLECKNLKGLTNDPAEWMEVYDNTWQSRRNSEAFSEDGGETYYLLSENVGPGPKNMHNTEKVTPS